MYSFEADSAAIHRRHAQIVRHSAGKHLEKAGLLEIIGSQWKHEKITRALTKNWLHGKLGALDFNANQCMPTMMCAKLCAIHCCKHMGRFFN